MLARSPNSTSPERQGQERAGIVLIASVSGRALAQAARRAGYRVRVADFFGDEDTRAAAESVVRLPGDLRDGVDASGVVSALDGLVEGFGGAGAALPSLPHQSVEQSDTPPHPASASLGHPLPAGERRSSQLALASTASSQAWANAVKTSSPQRGEGGRAKRRPGEGASDAECNAGSGSRAGRTSITLEHEVSTATSPVTALILGSGFERLPNLVDELADHFPLAGNSGETIRRVKDPERLAADCAEIGIPHPDITRSKPADANNWIAKTAGGAGGMHVAPAGGASDGSGRYFQRFVRGRSLSALFVADRDRAHIVGFSRQWTSPTPPSPYRYGGAVRLRRYGGERIAGWLSALTRRTGLVGLCSADFIEAESGPVLIEINPRPGATLDIFDCPEAPLLEAHVRACHGQPFALPRHAEAMASQIAYADQNIARFPSIHWPNWTADHQSAGSRIEAGEPICTVFGKGKSAAAARRAVKANLSHMERQWNEAKP